MRRKTLSMLVFLSLFIGMFSIFLQTAPTKAYEYPWVYAVEDAPVYNDNPDANHGSDGNAYCGLNMGYIYVKYLGTSIPDNSSTQKFTKAELYITRLNGDQTVNLNISAYLVTAEWSENTITWNNKPAAGTYIGSTVITGNAVEGVIDITKAISASGNLSLVLIPNSTDGSVALKTAMKEDTEVGITGSVRIKFTLDTTEPIISVIVDKTEYTEGPIIINWTSLVPLSPLTIELLDSDNTVVATIKTDAADSGTNLQWDPTNNSVENLTWSSLAGKEYKIRVRNADNSESGETGLFKLSNPASSGIPGYSPFLIGMIGLGMVLVMAKKVKRNM